MTTDHRPLTERPLAVKGLVSYRCRNRFGWTMIGAKDDADALASARQSWEGSRMEDLEVWNGTGYVPVTLHAIALRV